MNSASLVNDKKDSASSISQGRIMSLWVVSISLTLKRSWNPNDYCRLMSKSTVVS